MPPTKDSLKRLEAEAHDCRSCERLSAWLEQVDREKRAAFRDQEYWCRPVPAFGPARAELLIVGLAPGAHGANRTGRPFTGDGAGPFLYSALHRAGLASAPASEHRTDGLKLSGVRITNAVRCAPPGNKPTREEVARCGEFLVREIELMPKMRVILCLGGLSWRAVLDALRQAGHRLPRPLPKFGHGCEADLGDSREQGPAPRLVGSYHPSQLNTFTGRLTPPMFDSVLARALELAR